MTGGFRHRLFRDPIHGDIELGPIQAAIVDTPMFQRLRYIKQNGLLHFVFPGAVHTRFSHSIGTAYVAGRVFDGLAAGMRGGAEKWIHGSSLKYVEQVFVTAALLHDCGHSAFSHSIEGVRVNGDQSVFRSLEEMAEEWSTDEVDLSGWLETIKAGGLDFSEDHISHEEIGLLLIQHLNNNRELKEIVTNQLEQPIACFLTDVQSLINPSISCSEVFIEAATKATENIPNADAIEGNDRGSQLHIALSTLISGTLDVDRMDYLLRDSHYTGTAYGVYDFHILVNSIRLGIWNSGEESILLVCLQQRACSAFDDFLWSRYQLFNQVINHKTNVMLNAMLEEALEEIIDSQKARVSRPKDFKEFIAFTDEYIMSDVIIAALNEDKERLYKRVLVSRSLPVYLAREDITDLGDDSSSDSDESHELVQQRIDERKADLGQELGLASNEDIRTHITKCKFLKNVNTPYVIRRDKVSGHELVEPFTENDSYQLIKWRKSGAGTVDPDGSSSQAGENNAIPATVVHAHFFIDRDDLPK